MYSYGLLIEIEPGVTRPAIACNVADLTAARQLEQRKIALYTQVELLVADAARYGFQLPDGLRERACQCRGDLRELEAVRSALEDALLQPV